MSEASAMLHIHTGDDSLHEISAELLCQFVENLQKLTYLIAAAKSGMGNRKRIFGTAEFSEEYQIVCALPKAGSYVLPFKIRNAAHPFLDESAGVFSAMMAAFAGIAAGDISRTVLPDLSPENRARFARCMSKFVPKNGSSWRVTIDTDKRMTINGVPEVFEFSRELTERAEKVLNAPVEIPEESMSVIGELVSVNFESNSLVVRNYATHRQMECLYRPEVVDQILQNRSGGVQVTGKFTLDDEGNPKKLTDVTLIVAVDLSRIVVSSFFAGGKTIVCAANKDVSFVPKLDEETRQMFVVERDDLGVEVYASTRDELVEELKEQLAVNWLEYALAEDSELTETALAVKRNLLAHYSEEA